MKYLLIAILNLIYGILMFFTLSQNTPGYSVIFTIATILTILGLAGAFLWLRTLVSSIKEETGQDELINSWYQLVKSFDIILILGIFFRAFVMQPFVVEGSSMEPNFRDSQILLVDKLSYRFRSPVQGEVIIFKAPPHPEDDYIKRIIATPGQTVKIEDGKVFVNNREISEVYLAKNTQTLTDPSFGINSIITLGQDQYYVLGDNRNHSSDSRAWGPVDKSRIIGRPVVTFFPLNEFGFIKTPLISFKNALRYLNFNIS